MQKSKTLQPLSEASKTVEIGKIYEHYKGMQYRVLSVGRHSETLEEVVIYRALYGDEETWVRPLEMFIENVTKGGRALPRFKRVN